MSLAPLILNFADPISPLKVSVVRELKMLPTTFATPSRLAIFALEQGSGLPVARMPAYAEVIVRSEESEPPVDPFQGLDDPIQAALRADAPENLGDPEPLRRLLDAINRELVRQLGAKGLDKLAGSRGALPKFIATVIKRVRGAANGAALREIDGDALVIALRDAIREEAAKLELPLKPPFVGAPILWAYSLGVLATDHVGYLSYDLARLPLSVRKALGAAIKARSLDPAAILDVTVAVYPTGPGGAFFDALAQGRVTQDAIVSRFEIARLHLPDAIQNLALPAMQSPSIEDWRLSPGSFATNPGSLIGADGCESILPANLSLQEQYFYQVVRLRDVSVPVAPVVAQQVQLGVVNEYRVAWNPLGHSLGQIIYSMPLAPGESVNLAVIDWTRRDEAQRTERTTVDEQLVHNEHRDRTISEAVAAAAREYQHGSNFSAGVAGALGSSSDGTGAGIAGSLGGSTSSSSGSRDISGTTIQKLSDNITQASSSMRELQSTVVVHSTQSEKEAIETRTVVNYNHSHALTILYYEVLRHFRVVTGLVRQRPAVFVKFKTDWFDSFDIVNGALRSIVDNRAVLAGALLNDQLAPSFDAVGRVAEGRFRDLSKPFPTQPPVVVDLNPAPRFHFFTFEMRSGGFTRNVDDDDQHADVLAHLLLTDGSALKLVNSFGNEVLNHSGAFRLNDQNNVFTAMPIGNGEISWEKIRGIGVHVAVFPTDESDAHVSFSHIKITGFDLAGPPGVVLVDENHDDGHIVIRNQNSEVDNLLTLPTKRPGPAVGPVPIVSAGEVADRAQALDLIAHLKSNKRHYSRAIALGLGALERADVLDAIAMSDGSTVLDHIENRPLEIVGDFIAYPSTDRDWNRAITAKIANALGGEPDAIQPDERLVALPTRGVFAEAKLGHCNASEEIDNTRFWDWQQSPIPHFAPEVAPTVPVTPQPQQQNLSATPFPSSIVNIVNPPAAPDPTGLGAAFNVLGTPNLFRDMSGTALTTDLLKTLSDNAVKIAGGKGGVSAGTAAPTGGAAIGGTRAAPTQPSAVNRDLQDLGKVLGSAQAQGLITPDDARQVYTNAVSGTGGQSGQNAAPLSSSELQSLPVSGVRIAFSGSFQCRLATDPLPTDTPRADPSKPGQGWTFDYGESPFDRIIRLQSPVDLRSALVEPFVPVTVRTVEARAGFVVPGIDLPYRTVADSALLGLAVSLGLNPKFDSAAGGGAAFEAIINCEPTFGNLFKLSLKTAPKLLGLVRGSADKVEYLIKKPAGIVAANAVGSVVPPRNAALADKDRFDFYSDVFGFSEQSVPVRADINFISGDIPSEVFRPGWTWDLTLAFSRFDGDTLVGRLTGSLVGMPPPGEA